MAFHLRLSYRKNLERFPVQNRHPHLFLMEYANASAIPRFHRVNNSEIEVSNKL